MHCTQFQNVNLIKVCIQKSTAHIKKKNNNTPNLVTIEYYTMRLYFSTRAFTPIISIMFIKSCSCWNYIIIFYSTNDQINAGIVRINRLFQKLNIRSLKKTRESPKESHIATLLTGNPPLKMKLLIWSQG